MQRLMPGFGKPISVTLFLALFAGVAQAQSAPPTIDPTTVLGLLKAAMAPAINALASKAISWLGIFATLQFFITNYNLLKSDGDLQAVVAKAVGAVAWVGIVIYIINNGPQFIGAVGDQFFGLIGLDMPSPGSIIGYAVGVASASAALAIVISAIPLVGDTAGIYFVYISIGVLAVGMYMAFKIFMLQLELGLIAMLSPLSFAFLGLNTLKDQGIAPFKALLSLAYRIILLTVILSAFGQVSSILKSTLEAIDTETFVTGAATFFQTMLAGLGAFLLIFYLVFKSDSIAATLASGGTSMGTGDVAQAAAAGAAMGAAVASGGATAAATAGQVPATMREFMGNMMGGGTVNNASAMGNAAEPPPLQPSSSPAAFSVGGSGGSGPVSTSGNVTAQGSSDQASSAASASQPVPSQGDPMSQPTVASPEGAQPTSGTSASSAPAESDSATRGQASQANQPPRSSSVATGRIGPDLSDQQAGATTKPQAANESTMGQGSGSTAGIGGKPDLAERLGDLVDHLSKQTAPRPARLGDRLSEANRHMEKESGGTHVSINTHQGD